MDNHNKKLNLLHGTTVLTETLNEWLKVKYLHKQENKKFHNRHDLQY